MKYLRAVTVGLVYFGLWLLLSGHYTPLLIGLGILSCALVTLLAWRMDVLDNSDLSPRLLLLLPLYLLWLIKEIIKANIDVARRVLDPKLPISPTVVRVPSSQKTDLGRVLFANSITLTPGTVSTRIDGDAIQVHALTEQGAAELLTGAMDRRVSQLESQK